MKGIAYFTLHCTRTTFFHLNSNRGTLTSTKCQIPIDTPALKKCWPWKKVGSELSIFEINPRLDHSFRKCLVIWMAAAIHSKTIFSCSNSWGHLLENNLHPFEQLRLSVRKKSSSLWMAEVIHSKKGIRSKKNHQQQQDPLHFSCWAVYKHLFTMNPFLWLFERLESCSKRFFNSSYAWRHPFEIVC